MRVLELQHRACLFCKDPFHLNRIIMEMWHGHIDNMLWLKVGKTRTRASPAKVLANWRSYSLQYFINSFHGRVLVHHAYDMAGKKAHFVGAPYCCEKLLILLIHYKWLVRNKKMTKEEATEKVEADRERMCKESEIIYAEAEKAQKEEADAAEEKEQEEEEEIMELEAEGEEYIMQFEYDEEEDIMELDDEDEEDDIIELDDEEDEEDDIIELD